MRKQGIIHFVLLAILSGTVQLSPIAYSDGVGERSRLNTVEDLFFISEEEELSFNKDELNAAVLEKIKARILHSLKLKEAPKSHPPIPHLQTFQFKNSLWESDASSVVREHFRRNSKSEFLTSEIVPNTCFDRRGPQCLRFQIQIPKHLSSKNNTLSELWLYKRSGVIDYKIIQIIDEPSQTYLEKEYFTVSNQTELPGWTRFDVTELLNRISSNVLDLEIYSKSKKIPIEIGKDKNPLLIMLTKPTDEDKRSKRSAVVDCNEESTNCCRKKVYISFKDVGWDDWIVQPEGYNANICKGSCHNRLDLADNHHAHVLMSLMSKTGINNSEIASSIHCTPKTYKPLSIIYTDDKGVKVISNLPDMSVSECACS